jgi:hypothetical protein
MAMRRPGQQPLNAGSESPRVEHLPEVMGEKAAVVTGCAAQVAQPVLERGQRADAVRHLDPASPHERRQMQEDELRPAPGEKAAEDDKAAEAEVEDDQRISEG